MITMQRVTIKPQRGGFIFTNEEGQDTIMDGKDAIYELGGILETAAGDVTVLFPVEVPDGWLQGVGDGLPLSR